MYILYNFSLTASSLAPLSALLPLSIYFSPTIFIYICLSVTNYQFIIICTTWTSSGVINYLLINVEKHIKNMRDKNKSQMTAARHRLVQIGTYKYIFVYLHTIWPHMSGGIFPHKKHRLCETQMPET